MADKPIATHKVVDNRPMAPQLTARRIAECGPHTLVGGIIGPRHRTGHTVRRQEILRVFEIVPGASQALRYHPSSSTPDVEGRCPAPRSSTCFPSRHHVKAPLMAPVRPLVLAVFPSTCGQLLAARTGVCSVSATVVCPASGAGLPSPALPAAGDVRWPAAGARARAVPQRPLAAPPARC